MENRFETFTVLVNRISRNIRKIKNQEMAEYDLRSAHISCLYYLYANPGLTAIEAALEPEATDYYYYALGKDGRHHYSKTLNEHNAFLNSGDYIGN